MNYKKDHPDFGRCPKNLTNSIISTEANITYCNVEARKAESAKIREKYPDRIPVICEKSATSKLPNIDKTK